MDALSGFNSANELAKQLITLATGILALSITFIKDVLKGDRKVVKWPLVVAWFMYFCCIVFGIWTMMAVTGSIFATVSDPNPTAMYGTNLQIPAVLQILAFLLATIFLIIYGAAFLLRPDAIARSGAPADEGIESAPPEQN